MSVKIVIPSNLQVFTNNTEVVDVEGKTVGECLNNLIKKFPNANKVLFDDDGELFNYGLTSVTVYVNKEDVYPDGLAKPVKDGDEIHILYMISGG